MKISFGYNIFEKHNQLFLSKILKKKFIANAYYKNYILFIAKIFISMKKAQIIAFKTH